jgi:hypothetical protein
VAYPVVTTPVPSGSANPSPAYSGYFIPEIWSTKLIEKFYDSTVLAGITNTMYEGEIKNGGDKVIIRQRPTLTIRDYQANQGITLERPSRDKVELLIDKGKYFATILDDVMKVQMDINVLDIWTQDAAEQLKIAIDTEVLASFPASFTARNTGSGAGRVSTSYTLGAAAAPVFISADRPTAPLADNVRITDLIVDLGSVLDEQNCPETGRFLVVPSWVAGLLIKSDDFHDASRMGDDQSVLRNGRIGSIDRFMVYRSNLLPSATEGTGKAWWILAGHPNAVTFASQLSEVETMRMESTFGQQMRGLQVYGYKCIDPTLIAGAYVKMGPKP